MQDPKVLLTVEAINAAPVPFPRGEIRHSPRKIQAKLVRALLKDLGIRGVSVTAPNYSMAQAIDVRIPSLGCGHESSEERWECAGCNMRQAAIARLEALILAAYPDMADRSDTQSDHFDYCLSMGT